MEQRRPTPKDLMNAGLPPNQTSPSIDEVWAVLDDSKTLISSESLQNIFILRKR